MDKTSHQDEPQRQDDFWNWIVIALILVAVSVALYGPLIWEVARGV